MFGTDVILEDIQEDNQQKTKWIIYRIEEGWFTITLQTDNNENWIFLTANTNMRLTIEGNRETLNFLKRNNTGQLISKELFAILDFFQKMKITIQS